MADPDPPIRPLVVPPSAIPDPLQPAAVPAGQIPSLVPGGGRPWQSMDLGRQIATSVAGSSIADQMVKDFVRQQNLVPTTRYDPVAPLLEEYRKGTAMTPIAQSFRGESFDTAFRGQAGELKPDVVGVPDALRQAERGFLGAWNESFFGTVANRLMSYGTLYKAAQVASDPNYDAFNDPQIRNAGLDNQMHMFATSGSAEQTRLVIGYYQKRQKETEWLDRASGIVGWAGGAGALAASLVGDPTNFIPGSLGIKGLSLTMRGAKGALTGAELPLLYGSKAVYGNIADGLRFASINAAAMIAERALIHSLDPTLPGEMTADIILPSVIAGSLGLYTGIAARRVARKLAEETRQSDFLMPTSAPRYGAPNQRGGIIREPDAPHSGDFPPGSLATDYGDMRKAEMRSDPYTASTSAADSADFKASCRTTSWSMPRPAAARLSRHARRLRAVRSGRVGDRTFKIGAREGLFFTNDPGIASGYAMPDSMAGWRAGTSGQAPNLRPVHLQMKNPLIVEQGDVARVDKLIAQAKAGGHDGLILKGGEGGKADAYVVFKPEQVRSFSERYDTAAARPITSKQAIANLDNRGERDIIVGGKVVPANAHKDGDVLIDDNGIEFRLEENKSGIATDIPKVWKVISTNEVKTTATRLEDMEFKPGELDTAPGSVGAALNPASQAYRRDVLLDQGRMAPSGLGIENWGLTPVARLFRGKSVAAMDTTTKLVSTSGLQTKGNQLGIAQVGQPVEMLIQVNWNRPMVQVQRATQDAWTDYRRALANASQPAPPSVAGRSDSARVASQVGAAISDFVHTGEKGLSLAQFKERVGQALRQGDADQLGDSASSYVTRAAAQHRRLYNLTKEKAIELGMFDEAYKEAIDSAQAGVKAIKKEANQIKRKAASNAGTRRVPARSRRR